MAVIEMSIRELVERRTPATLSWSTGLESIDAMTGGGFRRGQVWVITGEPGIGKTVLLTQWAHRLAVQHSFRTVLHGHRADGIAAYRRWLIAMTHAQRIGQEPILDNPSLRPLMDADLVVSDAGYGVPRWRDAGVIRRALLIDDPEFKSDPVLHPEIREDLRESARAGAMVVVTAPLRHCFEATCGPGRAQLRQEWSETADVILEVVPHDDPWDLSLVIRRNRHGPCDSQPMARTLGGPWCGAASRRAEPTARKS